MTLGHMLAQIFKQCTVWTTKEININKTVKTLQTQETLLEKCFG